MIVLYTFLFQRNLKLSVVSLVWSLLLTDATHYKNVVPAPQASSSPHPASVLSLPLVEATKSGLRQDHAQGKGG